MDDSELDFVDLCSKLKRNRKKTVDQRQQKTSTQQSSCQSKNKRDGKSDSQSSSAVSGTQAVGTFTSLAPPLSGESGTRAKDKVLHKMQQFRRDHPQRMVLSDQSEPTESTNNCSRYQQAESQKAEWSEPVESDAALAMRLQQELNRETRPVDLEDEGLFFCQLCNKDLSHMTPDGRTQHINRCLDEKEGHIAPSTACLLECPICGQRFKSQKSRSSHLKRCSSDMGVPAAVLLQALQRQAEETQSTTAQSVGQKRKGSKSNMPPNKKNRKKVENLDEDTMMAMALSSSLLEQEREKERETQTVREIIIETTAPDVFKSPALTWKSNVGKGRSKKKKGGIPRPPPLLLVQDPGFALARVQERVSALLLRNRAPSPPTPTRSPSSLHGWQGTAPLWHKSALLSVFCATDFYTPEIKEFIIPLEATTNVVCGDDRNSTNHFVKLETPVTISTSSTALTAPQTGHSSSSVSALGTEPLLGCSQALKDLVDLAEDSMTLTQDSYCPTEPTKEQQSGTRRSLDLPSSGFVVEDQPKLGVSGFLPETLEDIDKKQKRTVSKGEEPREQPSLLLAKLALDLSGMVNNPQLSDVQLQVDSGEVFFAHSFMVYTRCPLLAEMIHESGFGVQEEGVPAAQRVLLNDVPGQAVFALLQFLYTAHCSFPSSLSPFVLELASRFDLKDLVQLCQLQEEATLETNEHNQHPDTQTDEAFIELLHSMWNDEDTEDEGADKSNATDVQPEDLPLRDSDIQEEHVNEDELVEIYNFAATQRQRQNSNGVDEEKKDTHSEEAEQDGDSTLDRSYNRLFSQSWGEFEEGDCSTSPENKSQSQLRRSKCPQSPEMSARMLLQSSASVIDKLSPSPPLNPQNLPNPGVSPGLPNEEVILCGGGEGTGELLKKANEPELVVLSDSSDDFNIDLTQSSNSPSPKAHYTSIQEQRMSNAHDLNTPPDDDADLDEDCSAEVSWLIPSTPVQPAKGVSISSSQSKSRVCRTQLFPKLSSSSHSPPNGPECSSASDLLHKTSSSKSSKTTFEIDHPKGLHLMEGNKLDSSGFVVPRSPSKCSPLLSNAQSHLDSSKKDTPIPIPAYSSTPLHTDVSKLQPDSPISTEYLVKTQNEMKNISPSPEKGVQSFHLSPLSVRSSSNSKTNSRSCKQNSISEDCEKGNTMEVEVTSLGNNEDSFEADVGECSFRHSFVDEPPIAFNDSWGLEACVENPCFSLKLDDSRGSLQHEHGSNFQATTLTTHPPMSPDQQSNARTNTFTSPNKKAACSTSQDEEKSDFNNRLMDSKIWDSWEEEDEEKDVAPPLLERLKPAVEHKTPISKFKKRQALVPITPMPHFSDMDTPDLKSKLNKFGVRPLPKRQMVLKLKEIHQYTHQLLSSDSEGEAPSAGQTSQAKVCSSASFRPDPCDQFKQPTVSPSKAPRDDEPLSASQGSNTSSTAESERSNPELVQLSDGDSDSDGVISASQSASRLQERLHAVRAFILSDSNLYNQILQYKPLVLSQFQQQLKSAGIRLGISKLADYLDSQCITFTTAKPGHSAPSRRRVKKSKTVGESGVRRKKVTSSRN